MKVWWIYKTYNIGEKRYKHEIQSYDSCTMKKWKAASSGFRYIGYQGNKKTKARVNHRQHPRLFEGASAAYAGFFIFVILIRMDG